MERKKRKRQERWSETQERWPVVGVMAVLELRYQSPDPVPLNLPYSPYGSLQLDSIPFRSTPERNPFRHYLTLQHTPSNPGLPVEAARQSGSHFCFLQAHNVPSHRIYMHTDSHHTGYTIAKATLPPPDIPMLSFAKNPYCILYYPSMYFCCRALLMSHNRVKSSQRFLDEPAMREKEEKC